MTNNCTNFYTRSEGESLEDRISRLEQSLELLVASFEAHTGQTVYEAHNYQPDINVSLDFHDNALLASLYVDGTTKQDWVDLSSLIVSDFDIEIVDLGNSLYDLILTINNYPVSTEFSLNIAETLAVEVRDIGHNSFLVEVGLNDVYVGAELQVTDPDVAVGFYQLTDTQIGLSVQVGIEQAQDIFELNSFEIPALEYDSNLKIDGIHQGDYLYLTVGDGLSQDTAQIYLDTDETNILIEEDNDMGCEQKIDDCCQIMEQLMAALSNQLANTESLLLAESQQIKEELTIEIEGETITEFSCSPDAELAPSNIVTPYAGKGLEGIHALLKTFNPNIFSNFSATCNLELDTVTLVASEQEVGRVDGNVLTIHFVTLDNYPKRKRGSGKRPIHIPAPKANYDWSTDFQAIRWEQGNQFAKLTLEGYKRPISGWFKDADAANATFDQLMTLTTATEKNRVIPIHSNPRTDIVERVSRPYRAFISRETVPGEPETLIKYFPPQAQDEE